jgi:hypothetical protein
MDNIAFSRCKKIAMYGGSRPLSDKEWAMADTDGRTIAHIAASYGNLPDDFELWGLADKDGVTVAHTAVIFKQLPDAFNQWDLGNNFGTSVGIAAAWHNRLPSTFDQWGMVSNFNGHLVTILRITVDMHKAEFVAKWEKERPLCRTEADWNTFRCVLPEIYLKYSVEDVMGDVEVDSNCTLSL